MTPRAATDRRARARASLSWARHVAVMVSPSAADATQVALERAAEQRLRRLADALTDRARQRRTPTRARMRALTVAPGGRFAWRDVPVPPPPGPDGAIVRPLAVATCDLDRPLALGATMFPLPLGFGHECVAEILEVGERVSTVGPGQRVVVPFQISCGSCPPCQVGHSANCASVPPISMYGFGIGGGHWGGAVADQLAVPYADAMLVPLPEGVEPAVAASVADNVSDAYRHIGPHLPDLLARDPDGEVLIVAALHRRPMLSPSGPLYAGQIALALGARHVRLVDSRPWVREHAARLGLTPLAPAELRACAPAPLVVDASTTRGGLRAALTRTAPDGVCRCMGNLHHSTRIPTALLYGRNVTFHIGRTHARTVIPKVLALIADQRLRPEAVTTCLAPLDDAPTALAEHVHGCGTKTILTVG